tara:strand:- start:936 stop:1424 length:489 start_codon:yes stop_codon:yes gene_type:complete
VKFGLTGDTHNNLKNIDAICNIFNERGLDFAIHTGDITLPKSLEKFIALKIPLHGVFGNNDQGDKNYLKDVCDKLSFDFKDEVNILTKSGKRIYIVHDPLHIQDSFYGHKKIIVHGHTHRFRSEIIKNTPIFNPGECAGFIKGSNSVGIVDIVEDKMEIIKF